MTNVRSMLGQVRSALSLFATATRVAGAIELRKPPHPDDLRRIGIDPRAFTSIGHG